MRIPLVLLSLLLSWSLVQRAHCSTHLGPPFNLRCESLDEPLGIDNTMPRLSWMLAGGRGMRQTAYQILVATQQSLLEEEKADLWSSGRIASDQSVNVLYTGHPLAAGQRCYWKVRTWDETGRRSSWSSASVWSMGLLTQADWEPARWIGADLELMPYQKDLKALPDFGMEPETAIWGIADSLRRIGSAVGEAPAVYLRKDLTVRKKVRRATIFACGLGLVELHLNGRKVGDHLLDPAPTDYEKRIGYVGYDVTRSLTRGTNAVGVILGNGWYNLITPHVLRFYAADYIDTPRLLFRLTIEYADGSQETLVSGPDWMCTTEGPIRFNCILAGETYDARKEMPGWDKPGFQATAWRPAAVLPAPRGRLERQMVFPVRRQAEIPAVSVERKDSIWRFDLGIENAGWARIRVYGKPGQRITLHFPGAPSHTLGRYQTDEFILKGGGEETFEPRFCYHGFRFIEVHGLDYQPRASDLTGIAISTDMPVAGDFACSDKRLDSLQKILLRTVRNYTIHIPNDPTREKAGWIQDVETGFYETAYNFSASRMYMKWQRDLLDIIHPNGYVPPVAPGRFDGPTINGPWWSGAIVYAPWYFYEFYGDSSLLAESYPAMKSYFSWLNAHAADHIVRWGLGDWLEVGAVDARPKRTPVSLTSTCASHWFARIMTRTASMLGKTEEAAQYAQLADTIRAAYNREFFNPTGGTYASGSQTAQLVSLLFDLVPSDKRELAKQKLAERIAQDGNHLSTGFVGTPLLLTGLVDLGYPDLAWEIATQPDYPGFLDAVLNRGNTVFKEDWKGGLVQMPSLQGPIGTWFYHSLAGIRPDTSAPGFKRIIIRPEIAGTLTWVRAYHDCPYGRIRSAWRREAGRFALDVTVPANTTATVYLPARSAEDITEENKPLQEAKGVKLLGMEGDRSVLAIGSGSYHFESRLP